MNQVEGSTFNIQCSFVTQHVHIMVYKILLSHFIAERLKKLQQYSERGTVL